MYGSGQYLETARRLMDWVIENCRDGSSGFTAGCDGWPEAGAENTYVLTYKSIEHNIDAFAAFRQLYARTGEGKYAGAAESALELIRPCTIRTADCSAREPGTTVSRRARRTSCWTRRYGPAWRWGRNLPRMRTP